MSPTANMSEKSFENEQENGKSYVLMRMEMKKM